MQNQTDVITAQDLGCKLLNTLKNDIRLQIL